MNISLNKPEGKNAVILINKDPGITSFDCLKYVKRFVNRKTGHCGTLDRFAQGLLIVCSGRYTKKVPLFMGLDKTYTAEIVLGRETDTLDPEGNVIFTGPVPDLNTVLAAVRALTGPLMQEPPAYSAVHINGKRSYQLARSGNEAKPAARPVEVFSAEVLDYTPPFLRVVLSVSKGTYIRSWARDLGHYCGTYGYVARLCRVKTGPFFLSEALSYNDISALGSVSEEGSELLLERLAAYRTNASC